MILLRQFTNLLCHGVFATATIVFPSSREFWVFPVDTMMSTGTGSITPKTPSEKIAILAAAGPAVKKT